MSNSPITAILEAMKEDLEVVDQTMRRDDMPVELAAIAFNSAMEKLNEALRIARGENESE